MFPSIAPKDDRENIGVWQCPRCGSSNRNETGVCSICGADLNQLPESDTKSITEAGRDEDLEITKVTNQLAGKLGISDYPRRMRWKSTYWRSSTRKYIENPHPNSLPIGRGQSGPIEYPVDPSYPIIIEGTILISDILNGRSIKSEDWAPIVASPLIYYTWLKGARTRGGLLRTIMLLVSTYLMLWGLGPFPSISYPSILNALSLLSVTWTIGFLGLMVLIGISWVRFTRRMVFRADSQASLALGREEMLAGLNRLESLRERDEQSGVKWPMTKPWSLKKRIDHINSG